MPKKLGTNPKAAEARERKLEQKRAENDRITKEKEDAYWQDDDKLIGKKLARREEQEKKRAEEQERKAANRAAYEEEMRSLPGKSHVKAEPRINRSQIAANISKIEKAEMSAAPQKTKIIIQDDKIEENINRVGVDGLEARTVEEAISILSVKDAEGDRHPERRVKAAFLAFEERMLPKIKADNPSMRLSQLKQILKKDWLKSPENPMNQLAKAYNSK